VCAQAVRAQSGTNIDVQFLQGQVTWLQELAKQQQELAKQQQTQYAKADQPDQLIFTARQTWKPRAEHLAVGPFRQFMAAQALVLARRAALGPGPAVQGGASEAAAQPGAAVEPALWQDERRAVSWHLPCTAGSESSWLMLRLREDRTDTIA
jgi:hypothetical protein